MDELVQWLRAQLDEDERIARDAGGAWMEVPDTNWVLTAPVPLTEWKPPDSDRNVGVIPREWDRSHIIRHDPAQVLREVDAKRAVVNRYAEIADSDIDMPNDPEYAYANAYGEVVRHLAVAYADRAGYLDAWRP
jgi:hypothetical protein